MRFAPRASSCSTNARPSPRFAPVTTATEPSILMAVPFRELPVVLCRRGRRRPSKNKTDSSVYCLPKKRGVTRPNGTSCRRKPMRQRAFYRLAVRRSAGGVLLRRPATPFGSETRPHLTDDECVQNHTIRKEVSHGSVYHAPAPLPSPSPPPADHVPARIGARGGPSPSH